MQGDKQSLCHLFETGQLYLLPPSHIIYHILTIASVLGWSSATSLGLNPTL